MIHERSNMDWSLAKPLWETESTLCRMSIGRGQNRPRGDIIYDRLEIVGPG